MLIINAFLNVFGATGVYCGNCKAYVAPVWGICPTCGDRIAISLIEDE